MIQKPSPNYSKTDLKKVGWQLHATLGRLPGTLNWLLNPESQASSHYLVAKDGTVYQLVNLKDRSWTSGRINKPTKRGQKMLDRFPNAKPGEYLIQIEVECLEHETYTEAQFAAITTLIQESDVPHDILLTHQDTASYKPHLEKERLNILRRLNGGDLLIELQIQLLVLQVKLWMSRLLKLRNSK